MLRMCTGEMQNGSRLHSGKPAFQSKHLNNSHVNQFMSSPMKHPARIPSTDSRSTLFFVLSLPVRHEARDDNKRKL